MAEKNTSMDLANAIPDTQDKIQTPEQPEESNLPPLNGGETVTVSSPQVAPTRRGRTPRQTERRPAMSKELKALIPTSERLHVYKRGDGGSVGYCADYSTSELQGYGTIEAFLLKYAVPKWDYGEYHLFNQKDGGKLNPVGKVTLVKPVQAETRTDMARLKDLMEAQQKMASDAKSEGASVFDGMAKMMGTMKDMQGSDGKSSDLMPMMLMMQMMQKPEPRGPDMVTQAIVRRLEDIEVKLSAPPPPPMPMMAPPAPPPDPLASIGPMLAGMMDTMGKMMEVSSRRDPLPAPPPQRDVLGELVQMKTLFTKEDGFGAKEVIALLPTLKDLVAPNQGSPQSLEEQLSELRQTRNALRELEHDFGPKDQGGTFWDNIMPLLGSLLGRKDLGQDVAAGISQNANSPKQIPAESSAQQESPIQIPEGFKAFADKINGDYEIGERIGSLIMGMQFLVQYEAFRAPVMAIFDKIKVNDREKALALFDAFLSAFVEATVLEQKAAESLFEGVQVHWDVIREKMGFSTPKRPVGTPVPSVDASEEAVITEEPKQAVVVASEEDEVAIVDEIPDYDGPDDEIETEEEVELDDATYEAAIEAQA